jgi:hypothetical protein
LIKKHGFVAVLDILGFVERVDRDPELGGLDRYIDTVLEISQPFDSLGIVLFSDTVVIYSFDDFGEAFNEIVACTSQLCHALLMQGVPLRGAISHGTFSRSEQQAHGTVIAGRPIIEAHYFESQLQWIGVMLAPSVLHKMPDLLSLVQLGGPRNDEVQEAYLKRILSSARVQACSSIPIEPMPGAETEYMEGFAIVPISYAISTQDQLLGNMSEVLAKLRWLKQLAPNPRSQAKYQHSIKWLEALYHSWILRLR